MIEPPVVIAEGLDIRCYDSIIAASHDLEYEDIRDNVYKGYDAVGRRLSIRWNYGDDVAELALESNVPAASEELRALVISSLSSSEQMLRPKFQSMSLSQLLQYLLEKR